MKTNIKLAIMAGALGLAVQANASWYDLSFTGTYYPAGTALANGQLDVVNGVATGGWLDVTGGPNSGDYFLCSDPSGVVLTSPAATAPGVYGGFTYDNHVDITPGAYAFLNTVNYDGGLVFQNEAGTTYFWLWYNNPTENDCLSTIHGSTVANEYGLWGDSSALGLEPQAYGNACLTPVPEPTTLISGALLLLPFGSSAVRQLRKKLQAA